MEAEFRRVRARRHKVCAAERRQKVVESNLVGQVDDREPQAPLVTVAVKQIVVTGANVEQVSRGDARRIVIVVFRSGRREADARGSVKGWIAAG